MAEQGVRKLLRRSSTVCQRCQSNEAQAQTYADLIEHKGLTLEVEGLQRMRCTSCGFEWATDGQQLDNITAVRAAYAARRDEIRERDGLLTGEQIALVLEQLDLNKAQAAAIFGGGPHAFSKYMQGEVLQSVAMDRLLRLALAFGRPAVEFLEQGSKAPLRLGAAYQDSETRTGNAVVVMHQRTIEHFVQLTLDAPILERAQLYRSNPVESFSPITGKVFQRKSCALA